MDWELDKNRAICPQICERISVEIASGALSAHDKLLSVRELAVRLGVNPNTVQKAFEQLETQRLIYSVRGSGWFVGEEADAAKEVVDQMIANKIQTLFRDLQMLGITAEQIKAYVKEWTDHE
ncbi:MAG: GntR family transcriptional regulator [Ruminococcaceae bacterium]|nr:GntR family transcriptional regulator [Oscillospiraceae bacterium]